MSRNADTSRSSLTRFVSELLTSKRPFWLIAIIVSFGPVLTLLAIDSLFIPPDSVGSFLLTGTVISLLVIYFLYSVRFISTRLSRLNEYIQRMALENSTVKLAVPYRPRLILVIWLLFLGVNTLLFGTPDFALEHVSVIAYVLLVMSLFLLAYGYSMLSIYRAGKLPLQLKPFTEDRMLGLKPFGTTSVQLASVYGAIPIFITIISTVSIVIDPGTVAVTLATPRPSDIIFVTGLVLVGIAFFFMPLVSIHRKLVEAKRGELGWIGPLYTRAVRRLKDAVTLSQDENSAQALASELAALRQLQQDVHRIQGWPFDLSIITRLATVLVLPPVLAVIARILILAFLRI